jgi:hypothetical protein
VSKTKKDPSEPRITMDYYHSTRRKKRRSSWPYAVSAVMMLLLLVLVVFFQDSCGSSISDSVFQLNQQ